LPAQSTQGGITMPITYLDAPPGLPIEAKRKLVRDIYDALHEAYPFPDDVRIFLREWSAESVSQDGKLGSEPARPVFMMHVPEGVNVEAKRKMLQRINAAVAEAYHLPKFMIFIQEYPLERVALDGGLHSDNRARVDDQKKAYGG
jgi:phenylpyruvate tautomerase PptA (4-oxalocrotonate tautomerase family)